jgi:hypothetical protein
MAVGTYVDGTWYSSLDPWTTVGPLMLIVGLTLMKEGIEDSKRHKADHAVWRSGVIYELSLMSTYEVFFFFFLYFFEEKLNYFVLFLHFFF